MTRQTKTHLQKFALAINAAGTVPVFCALSLATLIGLMVLGKYIDALLLLISFTVMVTIVVSLKKITNVPRPHNRVITPMSGSFPSGHSASTAFLVVTMPYFTSHIFGAREAFLALFIFLSIATVIVASRLILRVHTTYEVAAGLVIGALVPVIVIANAGTILGVFFR